MTIKELLLQCQKEGTAVLATNFYNFETLTAVMKAAQAVEAPVMLQLTRSSIDYMGLDVAVRMARQAISDYGLQGYIHLDHGGSVELVQRCLDAGFDSVMIDASEKPFAENVETTRKVVEMAAAYGVPVEAELGYVAKLGQEQGGGFTTPEEAKTFVDETGVDSLAVAIGSAHGFYKQPPHLDIPRLKAIHAATPVCLVLHGSSGICSRPTKSTSGKSSRRPSLRSSTSSAENTAWSERRKSKGPTPWFLSTRKPEDFSGFLFLICNQLKISRLYF